MPDRGLMEAASVEDVTFDPDTSFVLRSARWLQVTFEVARDAALSMLPPDVGRPIPPYARLLVASSPGGSVAVLSVGGRYRMMPRNVIVSVVADGPLEATRHGLGSGVIAGRIALERSGEAVTATVEGPEGILAAVRLPAIYAIEPTMLRWDGLVALARAEGSAVIAELAPAPELTAAFLSKGSTIDISGTLDRAHPWRRLRSLGVISACYAEGTLTLGAPAIQQTWA